jgi:hypothetical protein
LCRRGSSVNSSQIGVCCTAFDVAQATPLTIVCLERCYITWHGWEITGYCYFDAAVHRGGNVW